MAIAFSVNGKPVSVEAEADTPLLWVLRDDLDLKGLPIRINMRSSKNPFGG